MNRDFSERPSTIDLIIAKEINLLATKNLKFRIKYSTHFFYVYFRAILKLLFLRVNPNIHLIYLIIQFTNNVTSTKSNYLIKLCSLNNILNANF